MPERADARILLVDDDAAKRYTIAKTLIRAGFGVQEAGSGSEALRLVASLPDLVILDVKLPDIDGFEVCRRIKSDPATAAIPVLHISTTFVDIEDKVHGLDSGADGYLTNVAEPMELIATVRALLRARRAEDAAQLSSAQWQTTFDAISDGVMLLDGVGKSRSGQPDDRAHPRERRGPRSSAEAPPNCGMSRSDAAGSLFAKMLDVGRPRGQRPLFRRLLAACRRRSASRQRQGRSRGRSAWSPTSPSESEWRWSSCGRPKNYTRPASARTSSSPCWPTSCATPWLPLPIPCKSFACRCRAIPSIEESLDVARRQIQHMSRLLEDLLDVSRITRGTRRDSEGDRRSQLGRHPRRRGGPALDRSVSDTSSRSVSHPKFSGSRATRRVWNRSS